jgi:hypothetical protein
MPYFRGVLGHLGCALVAKLLATYIEAIMLTIAAGVCLGIVAAILVYAAFCLAVVAIIHVVNAILDFIYDHAIAIVVLMVVMTWPLALVAAGILGLLH